MQNSISHPSKSPALELDILKRMITEITDYAIIILDLEGNVISWNNGASNIKGYSEGEIIGKNFKRFYTQEDLELKKPQHLLKTAREEGYASDEGWRVRKDTTIFWASVTITAIHDAQGNLTGYSKVTRDLTERKRSEESLNKLRQAVSEIEDYAIILIDADGYILNWNRGAESIKGYKETEIIGRNFKQFYSLEDIDTNKPEKLLGIAQSEGRAYDEGWRIKKNGERFWASVTITAIHDENNVVRGYSKVTRDLTERRLASKKIEDHAKELEAKNHELNQFAYIASHDLQEPLNTVKSVISILQNADTNGVVNTKDMLDYISEATDRMTELITGLLEYGRIGQRGTPEEVDTNHLLKDVVADLQNRIKENKATVNVGKLPIIDAYKTELRLLFQNLISNGLKFKRKGVAPQIDISAQLNENDWTFCVKDNGIGIDDKFKDKLFMIFKRLPTEQEYEGTGIGLAHCKKVVDLHNGKIWVDSVPGKGSSFYFTIPLT